MQCAHRRGSFYSKHMYLRRYLEWVHSLCTSFAEYKTVKAVQGPLVILDKVKVRSPCTQARRCTSCTSSDREKNKGEPEARISSDSCSHQPIRY